MLSRAEGSRGGILRTSRRALAYVAVALAAVAPTVAGVRLAEAGTKNEQIQSLREQVEEASADEAALLDRLDAARATRRELDERVAALDDQLGEQEADLDRMREALDVVQAELLAARSRLEDAQHRAAVAREDLRRRVVAAYVGDPGAHATNLLLRVQSPRELANAKTYIQAVVRSQQQSLQHYRTLRAEATRIQTDVEGKVREVKVSYDVVVEQRNTLALARDQESAVRQEALRHEDEERALVLEVSVRKDDLEAQIRALEGESLTIEDMLRQRDGRGVAPGPTAGRFQTPIPGAVVTSPFGPRVHPIFGTVRIHSGIDMRGATGTPIRAGGGGEVVWAGPRGGYGNATIIDHGDGLATLYGHQSAILVRVGDVVTAGQDIGRVGSTGFATGPHLHFEVRANGRPVNPIGYL